VPIAQDLQERLMRAAGLCGVPPRRFVATTIRDGAIPVTNARHALDWIGR